LQACFAAEPEAPEPMNPIHALLLDGKGGMTPVPWDRIEHWEPGQGCLWLHFNYEDPEARAWLEDSSGLNEIVVSALLSGETRPRCQHRGDSLLLSLRGVNLSPGNDPEDMVSLRIWTDGKKVISTRRRKLLSTQDVLEELEAGNGPKTAAELLASWIDRIVRRMNDTVEDCEDQMLALEEDILNDETTGIRIKLSKLRKRTVSMRRYLAPQREAMNRLVSENLGWLEEFDRLRLRETSDRLVRYIEDIDEVRDRAALAQDELANRVSEQMNKRSYVFTVVATIFLPLSFFTGLMGINVGGMPGMEQEAAFWIVVAMCAGLTIALALLFRFKKWL
jgi:zinc transporter